MAHRFRTLETEMLTDPLVRDYASMTDIQVADDINTNSRTAPDRNSITTGEFFKAMVQPEFEGVSLAQQREINEILVLASGIVDMTPGAKERVDLEAMFSGTGTLTAMQALYSGQTFFRYQEIGLPGPVAEGHVADVRRSNP